MLIFSPQNIPEMSERLEKGNEATAEIGKWTISITETLKSTYYIENSWN
jgi:hypothetical protein